jgi:hypothetical protein
MNVADRFNNRLARVRAQQRRDPVPKLILSPADVSRLTDVLAKEFGKNIPSTGEVREQLEAAVRKEIESTGLVSIPED